MENKKDKTGSKRFDAFKKHLKNTYRLVVTNDETFEEVSSYRLNLFNIYTMVSVALVGTALLVLATIIFTPLKRYIPGYADYKASSEYIALNKQITEMEKTMAAHQNYADNFRKILVGDIEPMKDEEKVAPEFHDSLIQVERIVEDEQLRKEMKLEEIRQVSTESKVEEREVIKHRLEQIHFTAPLNGEISAGFMKEKKHFGIDVLAPKNTPVKAVLEGVVVSSDWTMETGHSLCIQHANNVISFYKHNSKLLKTTGDVVKTGEAIAIIGNTGTLSDGPHLHFELWYKGKPINPADYIIF